MIFRQLFDRESCTYTYLLGCADTREAILIDPVIAKVDDYCGLIDELELRLVIAADTHVHADHITALGELRDRCGCVTVMGEQAHAACVSRAVRDGDVVGAGSVAMTAVYTPGHTDDSYCFVMADRIFTGDTLLIRGTGRTDFQNGDAVAAWHSLFERVLTLPDETLVYPGHDYRGNTVSTIGEERRHNPRLQVKSAAEYAALMGALNLPSPALMDVAVPANRACGKPVSAPRKL
ncbi:MAG TPA: MBL fold metallo-hydrolase [Kofleriaceae bacterium]|nr:MBL fold metallo-hydrolase [Kofleriaceae bacterium]